MIIKHLIDHDEHVQEDDLYFIMSFFDADAMTHPKPSM